MIAALSSSVIVDTKYIKKYRKEVKKKTETQITRINQKNHENSVGNIVAGDSYNYRDTNVRYYVCIDIGKRNCVTCITNKEGMIIEEIKYGNT